MKSNLRISDEGRKRLQAIVDRKLAEVGYDKEEPLKVAKAFEDRSRFTVTRRVTAPKEN